MINFPIVFISFLWILIVDGGKTELEIENFDCSKNRIEMAIILDSSSSIGVENFTLAKQFLVDIVADFAIGQDKSRIGMVTFADDPEILFTLNTFKTIEETKKAILTAKFLTGVTAMGAAIKLAGTGVLQESRSGVQKVMLLVTDGRNNKFPPATKMAKLQKEAGVIMIAVGIGSDTSPEELKEMSSEGQYYKLDSFKELAELVKTIKKTLCKVIISNIQIDTCETEGDISFVIDSKEKAGELYKGQIELISSIFHRLEISQNKQRVAIVIDNEGILVQLNQFKNRTEYIKHLTKSEPQLQVKKISGLVESGRLLSEDRPTVPKLIVVLRTHNSNDIEGNKKAALALRNQGFNIVTVAFGKNVNPELLNVLSSTRNSIILKDTNYQVSFINEMSENICQNLKKVYTECIGKKLDLTMVLDCSSSIGPENWLKQLQFVSRIVSMMDIGKDTSRIGCVYFNSEAYVGFSLDKYDNKNDIIKAIRNLPYSEGGTAIGDALKLAYTQIMSRKRNDTISVMVLLTDGQSNMGIKPESQALEIRNEGIHIICIGITDEISKGQLMRISSTNRFYQVNDFKFLDEMSVEPITKESCQAIVSKPKKVCRDFQRAGNKEL